MTRVGHGGLPATTPETNNLLSAWRESKVPTAYASKLLNDPDIYDPACKLKEILDEFGFVSSPSLHIGDNVEPSISTVNSDGWMALTDTGASKRSKYYSAKQPNGHARMLTCTTAAKPADIARVISVPVAYIYMDSVVNIEDILHDVIPTIMAPGSTLVVRVPNPILDYIRGPIIRASTYFKTLKICKPRTSDALDPEVFAVFERFSVSESASETNVCEDNWNEAVRDFESIRAKNVGNALDLIAYFNGIGLDTEEDCDVHERKTRANPR
jgi:hypothetical protein